jgi:WD40 repeat protein
MGTSSGSIYRASTKSFEITKADSPHELTITGIHFLESGTQICAVSLDCHISLWAEEHQKI